ncbi:MAG: ABC transporter permease, partial [Crocosphaera sp.]
MNLPLSSSEVINKTINNRIWYRAWQKFCRDYLAIFGLMTLTIIIVAVIIGPFIYQVPIDRIDFSHSS